MSCEEEFRWVNQKKKKRGEGGLSEKVSLR